MLLLSVEVVITDAFHKWAVFVYEEALPVSGVYTFPSAIVRHLHCSFSSLNKFSCSAQAFLIIVYNFIVRYLYGSSNRLPR